MALHSCNIWHIPNLVLSTVLTSPDLALSVSRNARERATLFSKLCVIESARTGLYATNILDYTFKPKLPQLLNQRSRFLLEYQVNVKRRNSIKPNNEEITHSGINTIYYKQLYICIFFTAYLKEGADWPCTIDATTVQLDLSRPQGTSNSIILKS